MRNNWLRIIFFIDKKFIKLMDNIFVLIPKIVKHKHKFLLSIFE